MMTPSTTRVAYRFLQAASLRDQVQALAGLDENLDEDDIYDAMGDGLAQASTQLVQQALAALSFITGGNSSYDDGREDQEHGSSGDLVYTGSTIEFPTLVTGTGHASISLRSLVTAIGSSRLLSDLPKRELGAFLSSREAREWVARSFQNYVDDALGNTSLYPVQEKADDAAWQASDQNTRQTIYREDDEEEQHVVPDVRYSLSLRDPVVNTQVAQQGNNYVLFLQVDWEVRFGKMAFPGDYNYDRI